MKVYELINILKECNPAFEVKHRDYYGHNPQQLVIRQNIPGEVSISSIKAVGEGWRRIRLSSYLRGNRLMIETLAVTLLTLNLLLVSAVWYYRIKLNIERDLSKSLYGRINKIEDEYRILYERMIEWEIKSLYLS